MKRILLVVKFMMLLNFYLVAQVYEPLTLNHAPFENYYDIKDFPRSSEKISFSVVHPFVDYKDSTLDKSTSWQSIMKFPLIRADLLSEYIKFTMLSINFEQKFNGSKDGAEIWYGATKGNIPTVAAIYYDDLNDSTYLYVLIGYSLTYFDKKSKEDLSKVICERVQAIMSRDNKRKKSEPGP